MPSAAKLDWRGDELLARVTNAARAAVNETVEEAAADARSSHTWLNRTGQLEEEIVVEEADPADPNPSASFGTTRRRGFYGYFHELGTVHEMGRPFLRPAADRSFPTLAGRIRQRLAAR